MSKATTLITIDLGALAANWRRLAAEAAPAECAAVVKADAYGIGIDRTVPALSAAGCRTFFVALPAEGRRVRLVAPDANVYVLNGFLPNAAELYHDNQLRPVLNSPDEAQAWAQFGRGMSSAVQVDTGMNRLGFSLQDALQFAQTRDLIAATKPALLMSHFACADDPDHPLNEAQLALFGEIRREFPGIPVSLANSAGVALGARAHFDLVRPGIALYGAEFSRARAPLAVVVTLEASVLQVRDVPAGGSVGYGAAESLQRGGRVAIVSAGYADGYLRMAGSSDTRSGAKVYVRGRYAPLIGRVSMDLAATDVSELPLVRRGDRVEMFGPNVPIDDVARTAGTIAYELLTGLSRRAERGYLGV